MLCIFNEFYFILEECLANEIFHTDFGYFRQSFISFRYPTSSITWKITGKNEQSLNSDPKENILSKVFSPLGLNIPYFGWLNNFFHIVLVEV